MSKKIGLFEAKNFLEALENSQKERIHTNGYLERTLNLNFNALIFEKIKNCLINSQCFKSLTFAKAINFFLQN